VEISEAYRHSGVRFILVNPTPTDKLTEMRAAQAGLEDNAIYVFDEQGDLSSAVGARSTADVIVLDSARTVVYHGSIDDQYGLGYSLDSPRSRYLIDGLTAILAGRQPAVSATSAPGCVLDQKRSAVASSGVTYYEHISRLVQRHCIECHREGGVAPFSLETYDDLLAHAAMIQQVVERGVMPPWFAAADSQRATTPWRNDRSMATSEIEELVGWLEGDRTLGNPEDAPLPPLFAGDWTIGTPDLIVQLPQPVAIKAQGTMPYQFVTAETTLADDRWVQAYEIVPTDRSVVHHVIVNVHDSGLSRIRDLDEGVGGYWAAYVPGNTKQVYPPGFARKLKAGSKISFQIHYTPNGQATQDQLKMGLIFANEPPQFVVETFPIADRSLNIPPREEHHVETASRRISEEINVLAYMAHMHVRGKSFKYELEAPDGTRETLLDIPRYDFNWQLRYDYAEPRRIAAGSTIKVTAAFDNSANNPANPDPSKTVRWGPQTFDEMLIGYVETFRPIVEVDESLNSADAEDSRKTVLNAVFNQLDRNSDGLIQESEIPAPKRQQLLRLDTNDDGAISLEEALRLRRWFDRR
jgi:hypothetical protein